jgi:hypothetical protein
MTNSELLTTEFPARDLIVTPWMPRKGLALIVAGRGIGKTWVAFNVAHMAAVGGTFWNWRAPKPVRVVFIDGEMPAAVLQERYRAIVLASNADGPGGNLQIVAADLQPDGLPDLSDPLAQRYYDDVIKDADLVIVDNVSTVCRALRENEADTWGPVQEWALRQRAANRSVLFVHHAGKNGTQRGTSKKEDPLDTVIELRRPADYDATQGARFEVHFTKNRGFWGDDAKSFEARLNSDGSWTTGQVICGDDDVTVKLLRAQGLSERQIAERTGLSKTTVHRILNPAKEG